MSKNGAQLMWDDLDTGDVLIWDAFHHDAGVYLVLDKPRTISSEFILKVKVLKVMSAETGYVFNLDLNAFDPLISEMIEVIKKGSHDVV